MNFDLNIMNEMLIPTIIICSLVVGFILKKWLPTDNRYIPTILVILGGILGALINGISVDSITAGMLSGLASTGLHQLFTQYLKINNIGKEELYAMGPGEVEDSIEQEEE